MAEEEYEYEHLQEQDYENDISCYEFITFVKHYRQFLLAYINNKYRDDPDEVGYLTSFIDICEGININMGDEGSFEQYREQIQPLMEWVTLWAQDMNIFYERQQVVAEVAPPKNVADRTRSKLLASNFEIPPAKRGTNMITLEPTKQEGVRITLSDGKEYTYEEIKGMWQFSNIQTPLRHLYTAEDKKKITDLIDFATKGGKKTRKNKKKSGKTRKSGKNRKSGKTRKSGNTRKSKKTGKRN